LDDSADAVSVVVLAPSVAVEVGIEVEVLVVCVELLVEANVVVLVACTAKL
jgi:hypothetical protein